MIPLMGLWAIPWVRKAVIYAVIIAAVLYALRLWGNKQWAAGEQAGRVAGLLEAEKLLLQTQAEAERQLNLERQALIADRATLLVQQAEIGRNRKAIAEALSSIIKATEATRTQTDAVIDRIPATELDSALRIQSNRLAGPIK